MVTDFSSAFESVRPSVVGLGFLTKGRFDIIGTGFIVSEQGWILTNRHVLEPLLVSHQDSKAVRANAVAVLFAQNLPGEQYQDVVGLMGGRLQEISFPPEPAEEAPGAAPELRGLKPSAMVRPVPPDLGLCKISLTDCPREVLPLRPLRLSNGPAKVGSTVAILGFPQGLTLPDDFPASAALQLSPLLQVGQIAAALPFSALANPENYVLDLYVNGGSSGSPLFTPEGEVVGVVYATRQGFAPLVQFSAEGVPKEIPHTGTYVASALRLAVPATRIDREWLKQIHTTEPTV